MGAGVRMTFEVEREKADELNRLARAIERPRAWLLAQALENYLAGQRAEIQAIEEGIHAADRGELVDHERVREWLATWGRGNRRPAPE